MLWCRGEQQTHVRPALGCDEGVKTELLTTQLSTQDPKPHETKDTRHRKTAPARQPKKLVFGGSCAGGAGGVVMKNFELCYKPAHKKTVEMKN